MQGVANLDIVEDVRSKNHKRLDLLWPWTNKTGLIRYLFLCIIIIIDMSTYIFKMMKVYANVKVMLFTQQLLITCNYV